MNALPADTALPPLIVDLDGTLIRTDLLHESALKLARQQPASLLSWPGWLARGKAFLKRQIADRVSLDWTSLPYNEELLARLRQEKGQRRLVLCTASDQRYAQAVADHLQLFDEVLGSDGQTNLSATRKAQRLVERFGAKGFDYVGNSRDDLPVWRQARHALVVNAPAAVARQARAQAEVVHEQAAPDGGWRTWLRALRAHQWLKNLLIFLPLAGSFQLNNPALLGASLLAFVAFSLCASSVYLLNDLMDLENDRVHPRKRLRPFASGALSSVKGLVASALLLAGAAALAWQIGTAFAASLACYLVLTLAYTFALKSRVLVDCIVLGLLYTLRVVAGLAAAGLAYSFWLLAFSLFLFTSLAFVKRFAELQVMLQLGRQDARGRGYLASDLPLVMAMGVASGFSSVLVLALYINDPLVQQRYQQPELMWLGVPVLLYWVCRMWMQAQRGHMHDDPVVFAARDRYSWACVLLFGALLMLAR